MLSTFKRSYFQVITTSLNCCPIARTFLEVDSMVFSWWIVAFLCNENSSDEGLISTTILCRMYSFHDAPGQLAVIPDIWGQPQASLHFALEKEAIKANTYYFYFWDKSNTPIPLQQECTTNPQCRPLFPNRKGS